MGDASSKPVAELSVMRTDVVMGGFEKKIRLETGQTIRD
jgi:hypothetical protein